MNPHDKMAHSLPFIPFGPFQVTKSQSTECSPSHREEHLVWRLRLWVWECAYYCFCFDRRKWNRSQVCRMQYLCGLFRLLLHHHFVWIQFVWLRVQLNWTAPQTEFQVHTQQQQQQQQITEILKNSYHASELIRFIVDVVVACLCAFVS